MKAIGLRMQDQQRAVRRAPEAVERRPAADVRSGLSLAEPSGFAILSTLWGKAPPDTNQSRFRNADYDAAYEAFLRTPPGPTQRARTPDVRNCRGLCPDRPSHVPIGNAFVQPWLKGYYPASFGFAWKYVDIDLSRKRAARQ